jgi:PPOX class probable F420-dependent enzyme
MRARRRVLVVAVPVAVPVERWRSRCRRRRDDEQVDIIEAVDFVRRHHRAILATRRRDGTPQMSPVVVGTDSEDRLLISSREKAMKVRNLRRSPVGWLCVFSDGFFGPWIQVSGEVDVVSLPGAMEGLVGYYRSVAGEHPDWDEYRTAMRAEQRVLVRLTPRRAGPDVSS